MIVPRIMLSALRGGSGKTILSIGVAAAWTKRSISVAPFKKGPDYIDAGWLALAAGQPCHNLDTFLQPKDTVLSSFHARAAGNSVALIEGNRGLYDGTDTEGSTSTAELARMLECPVLLIIDCTKSTRTMAAAVLGCLHFDPGIAIQGVILNRIAGQRHETTLRRNIELHCGIPVVGAVPKLKQHEFPERHMGLLPIFEHAGSLEAVARAGEVVERYVDLDQVMALAEAAPAMPPAPDDERMRRLVDGDDTTRDADTPPRIGILRDSAFQFYYPENLEALEAQGAQLVTLSPLKEGRLPSLDGLYLGGGFPETHVEALAENRSFREDLRRQAEAGLPVYAECGGLMYLGESITMKERTYPMAGVLPVAFGFSKRPQGHGYTEVCVEHENPYYEVGTIFRGHEFHYSFPSGWRGSEKDLAFSMRRGTGFLEGRDGVVYKNVLATYTHIHALGTPEWATAMVAAARRHRTNGVST
jgi:cobyrinic acid a,c-diamide synthase